MGHKGVIFKPVQRFLVALGSFAFGVEASVRSFRVLGLWLKLCKL